VDVSLRSGGVFSATPWAYNNTAFTLGTMAENGAIDNGRSSNIQERCQTNVASQGVSVLDATMTGTLVNSLSAGPNQPKLDHSRPVNRFAKLPKPTRGRSDHPAAG